MLLNLDRVPDNFRLRDLDRDEVGRPLCVRDRVELRRVDRLDRNPDVVRIGIGIVASGSFFGIRFISGIDVVESSSAESESGCYRSWAYSTDFFILQTLIGPRS